MHVVSAICLGLLMQTPPAPQRPPVAGQAQTPGRDQAQRPPLVGKGSLAGTVVSENGQPVKGARVSANGPSFGRTVVTDATGAFLFDKLPEGRYSLSANRQRFLSSSYGQKRPERPGTSIQLGDGEQLKGLTITLFNAAVITGAIYTDDGEPVQGAQVRALKYTMANGIRRLQQSNGVQSDDRGFYRIFGLTPGEYIVTASSNQGGVADSMTPEMQMAIERAAASAAASGQPFNVSMNGNVLTLPGGQTMEAPPPVTFAPTYYPGTATPASAVTIVARGGEERSGVDISLQKVQTANISGTVISASGPLPQSITVQLQSNDEAGQGIGLPSARVAADGKFSLRAVPPGQYTIVARATTTVRQEVPVAGNPASGMQTIQTIQTTSTGRAMVAVDGQSVNGVVVTLDGGRTLTGRVVFDGVAQPDPAKVRMVATLQPAPSAQSFNQPSPPPGEISADGSFKISGISPGRYTLRVSNAMGLSMKSSMVAGRDSLDFPFDVDTEDIHGAVVTMGSSGQPSELTGLITDIQGKPAVDYTIVVFSADQRFWTPGSRRIFTLRPGTDGRYTLRGAPPGEYQIAAMSDLEPGTQYDPELLKTLFVASTRVTLGEGAKLTQDLRVNNR